MNKKMKKNAKKKFFLKYKKNYTFPYYVLSTYIISVYFLK
jgi:hypothetical protein